MFLIFLTKEINRIENFVTVKVSHLEELFDHSTVISYRNGNVTSTDTRIGVCNALQRVKKDRELSVLRTYSALYRKIVQLESFCYLNVFLSVKILKKYDNMGISDDHKLYSSYLESVYKTEFAQWLDANHRIGSLKRRIVETYADLCCDGDRFEAKGKLDFFEVRHTKAEMRSSGVRLGVAVVLLLWFLWESIMEAGNGNTLWNDPAIYVYAFLGNVVIHDILWALNVHVWESAHVNYLVLLDLRAEHSPDSYTLMSSAFMQCILFLMNLILYYKSRRESLRIQMPPHLFPVALALMFIANASMSVIKHRHLVSSRLFSPEDIFRIVSAPFSAVSMRETILAEVMISFVKVYSNFAYACCYMVSGAYKDRDASLHSFGTCNNEYMFAATSVLAVLPLWFRFAQCLRMVYEASVVGQSNSVLVWPHSYNALKYLLSMIVVLFGLGHPVNATVNSAGIMLFRAAYILLLVISTLYSFLWDLFQNFGLMEVWPTIDDVTTFFTGNWHCLSEHIFLRPRLMYYKHVGYYYIAIALDLVLMGMWTLSLIPQGSSGSPFSFSLSDQLGPFLAAFELCRRCIWLILKLEYEHLRAVSQTDVVLLHIEKQVPDSNNSNMDIKVALYHLFVGLLILVATVMIFFSI